MKRHELLNHLKACGCIFLREGGSHSQCLRGSSKEFVGEFGHGELAQAVQ